MSLQAGFAVVDITPPVGTHKIGWIIELKGERVLDPLYARVAIFTSGRQRLAVIALDTLSVRWSLTQEIRTRLANRFSFPADAILVAATHNHAGPAVTGFGKVPLAAAYVEDMLQKLTAAFGEALARLQPAEIGFAHGFEWRIAHNRRIAMRDGTTKTHGTFNDINALCYEGPVDPEVSVMAVRRAADQKALGCIVNYTCHPTHAGGGTDFSGGYPAAVCKALEGQGWPIGLYLNGACGNIHDGEPAAGGKGLTPEEIGRLLCEDVQALTAGLTYSADLPLKHKHKFVELAFRDLTEAEIRGTVTGAQRFSSNEVYDSLIVDLVEKIKTEGKQRAELQALFIGDHVLAAIPAEYFVEFGLKIKEQTWPKRTLVVSCANGMVGYLPTREAFRRGGYETTFYNGTCLAHDAGDKVTNAMIRLVKSVK